MNQGERGCDLKKCRVRLPILDQIAEHCQPAGDLVGCNHLAAHPNPLAESHEVRGGKEPGAITGRARDGIDHGADGTFAVGPGDVNDSLIRTGNVQLTEQTLDVFEPKLDPETLCSVKPGERFPVNHCVGAK